MHDRERRTVWVLDTHVAACSLRLQLPGAFPAAGGYPELVIRTADWHAPARDA
jgi:hypothetical protein